MASDDKGPTVPDLSKGVSSGDLPDGAMMAGHIGDDEVLLARQNGKLFALSAHCTHYHGPLADGLLVGYTVRCPWHHARFNLETGEAIATRVTFDVQAQRRDARGARDVVLPYFATVVQGGTNVVSKGISRVGLHFADGQLRAQSSGSASSSVQKSAASLPEDVRRQVTRERKAGDADAAVDPMSDPKVREAVRSATFELLVGFQLTQAQLAYNATR